MYSHIECVGVYLIGRCLIMKEIDRLIRRAKKKMNTVLNVIFVYDGKCTKCHKPSGQCLCRNQLADERVIEFVKVRSREEAQACFRQKD